MKNLKFDPKRILNLRSIQNWTRKLPKFQAPKALVRLANSPRVRKLTNSPGFRKVQQNKVVWLAGAMAVLAFTTIGTIRMFMAPSEQPTVALAADQTSANPSESSSTTEAANPVEIIELEPDTEASAEVTAVQTRASKKPAAPKSSESTKPAARPSIAVNKTSTTTKAVSVSRTEQLPFEILEVEEKVAPPTKSPAKSDELEIIDMEKTANTAVAETAPKKSTPAPAIDPTQAKRLSAAEVQKRRKFNRIEATIKKHPEQEAKARKYGTMLTNMGEYKRGERFYLWYLKSHPQDGKAFHDLGWLYQITKRWKNACRAYQRAADLDPEHEMARNNLAWILATCPDTSVRDGARAVKMAKEANSLLEWPKPSIATTMAAAYAEAGNFRAAVRIQKWAIRSAKTEEKAAMMQKLEMYRNKQPYRIQ